MFISGFTFVRNAVKYDYPVEASVRSMLPLVDELIVCLGNSDDTTESLINSIADPRIKIIHSTWDDSLREGGRVLAVETNKALDAVNPLADWCIYLQADEVIHEDDYAAIRSAMNQYKENKKVEGLLFKYLHFYGNYNYIGDSRKWYRYEIRIFRNDKNIRSYKDAQGFRYGDRKLNVKEIPARIFHYGWVKNPLHQSEKQKSFHKLWHSDEAVKKKVKDDLFDYSAIDSLALFKQTHPSVMQKRIDDVNWEFTYDVAKKKLKLKDRILLAIEKVTGYRFFEYKNYQKI
jgi:hypothetical protein